MATKKVVLNGQTLIDLTLDTVEPEYVAQGKTFHGRDGEIYSGTYRPKLENLTITENGIYTVNEGFDGYGELTVEVTSGTVDPSMKPTLVPPSIAIAQDTSTLTITDSYNDHHTEFYDIYLNGQYALTVHQPTVKMASYFELLDTTQIAVTARAESFNTSERSNTVLWKVYTPTPSTSTSGRLNTPSAPYVNGAKKTLVFSSDSNNSSYTGGYRVYCNDVEILDIPYANRTQVQDISEFVDYSVEQYFSIQAYVKTGQTNYTKDSLVSSKRKLIVPSEPGHRDYFVYTLNNSTTNDQYYTCSGFNSNVPAEELPVEIDIPNYYNDLPIRYVGGFSSKPITKVTMHEGMLGINSSAFSSCTSLIEVNFANTTSSIGSSAFYNCTALTSIIFPKSLSTLNSQCFQSCSRLFNVSFGECKNSVDVQYYAFQGCSSLTALYMNEASLNTSCNTSYNAKWFGNVSALYFTSAKAICRCSYQHYSTGQSYLTSYYYNHPFYNTSSKGKIYLNNVDISVLNLTDDITSIGRGCFQHCNNISSINLNNVTTINMGAFAYSSIQAVFTTSELTTIDTCAFAYASSLEFFDFKIGLITINQEAFYSCTKLNFSSLPSSLKTIGPSAFYNNDALVEVRLPSSISSLGSSAFASCDRLSSINFPILLTVINSSLFSGCVALTQFQMHWRVTTIGGSAFNGCVKLETINLVDNITSIEGSAFAGCVKLILTEFPKQLLTVGGSVFSGCSSLKEFTIHDGVYSVGGQSFYNCTNLESLYIGQSVQTFNNTVLQNCKKLATLTVHPDNKTFYSKDNVLYNKITNSIIFSAPAMEKEELELDEVATISSHAFQYSRVKRILPANGLKTINSYAFDQSDIEYFNFVPTITTISNNAFANCGQLVSVHLPEGISSLGSQCFYNDIALQEISFGNVIKTIPSDCCFGCTKLKTISFPESVTTFNSNCFYNCYSTENVVLPIGTTSVGSNAFYRVNFGKNLLPNITTNSNCFQQAVFEELDLRGLTKNIATSAFTSTTINKLYFTENKITVNYQGFYGTIIEELYLVGEQPIGSYYNNYGESYYSWYSAQIQRLYIYNLDSWMAYDSSYNNGLYQAKEKYILDLDGTPMTSVTLTVSGSWVSYKTQNFKNIENLAIEGTATYIQVNSFLGWTSLKYFYFNLPVTASSNWSTGSNNPFYGIKATEGEFVLEIGPAVKGIPQYFVYELPCTEVRFTEESTCTSVGSYGFSYAKRLRKISLPDGLTTLNTYAFYQSAVLEECPLPASLTTISQYAFQYCYCLKEIDLTNVTSLSTYVFQYCYCLSKVTLPTALTTIPTWCFGYCRSLSEIDLTGYVTIGTSAFYDCDSLHHLTLPDSLTTIGQDAFRSCSALISLTVGSGLTTVNSYAFYECNKLYEVYNSSSLALTKGSSNYGYIAYYAKAVLTPEDESIYFKEGDFVCYLDTSTNKYSLMEYEGDLLETLVLPATIAENPYTLTSFAFSGKHHLKDIVFPDIPFSISSYCFSGCSSLETVSIPQQITAIGTGAFGYCPNIKKINYSAENITTSDTASRFAYAGYLSDGIELFVAKNVKSLPTLFYGSVNSTPSSDSSVKITKVVFEEISVCQNFGSNCFSGVSGPLEVHVTEVAGWLTAIFNNTSANPLNVPNAKLIVTNTVENKTYLLEELECPTNVFQIKNYVFSGYDYLTKVIIGNHVTSIGTSSFYNCSKLQYITLGEKLTSIGSGAFSGCAQLSLVEYKAENVTSTNSAFNSTSGNATNPTKLIIGSKVKRIPNSLFADMSSLEQVVFEENLNNLQINNTAFPENSIQKVYVSSPENWLTFAFQNRRANPISNLKAGLYVIEGEEEKLITDIIIPSNIVSISPYAFCKYKELKSISIHKDVVSIGVEAFVATPNLENISLDPENLLFIEEQGMLMPITKDTIYGTDKNYVGEVSLPEDLLEVPAYCFYSRRNITDIIMPSTIQKIGEYAFYNCSSLNSVNLPENLTTLGDYAFWECLSLESIYYNCKNLGSMNGRYYCFQRAGYNNRNTTGLTVYLGSEVQSIAPYLFYPYSDSDSYRAFITKIDGSQNNKCTSIGNYSFCNCYWLKDLLLPKTITTIGSYAFHGCQKLTAFPDLPNLRTVSDYAFYNNRFVSVQLPNTLISLGQYVFYNVTTLLDVYIPLSVTTVGYYAFSSCMQVRIYCEATSIPSGWNSSWNPNGRPVVWGYYNQNYTYVFVTNTEESIENIISPVFIQLPTPAQEDKYFWGWYLQEDFSGEQLFPNQYIHGQMYALEGQTELVLYGRWEDEPNGTGSSFSEARRIGINQTISVSFPASSNASKYFIFTAKETKTYYVTASAPNRTRCYAYNSTNSNSSINSSSNITNSSFGFSCTAGNSYVVRFYPYSTSYAAYNLTFSVG